MGVFRENGQRITKAAFPAAAVSDALKRITEDVYQSVPYGPGDGRPEGSIRRLLYEAGTVVLQSEIDRLFATATIASVSPATGPATGGTTVTIKGTELDGTSAVNFGSTADTEVQIVSAPELRVKTPAGSAGAVNVVLIDDAGSMTRISGFTYS
ncbi:IPT/TIG domain-containing protein [Streptomyces sp. CMB-StM0423]|uniref:IPT/TIG domain-containing protein n=1 Tax=Streptomyces sp. CMB-StM0423 TaxID=2059884 RepID=UPI000C70DCC0|nr:IPT/TIG domain-containing protein [Streptomyces sp. CMB-StM0423]AUH40526.1 hypothetical protein CXR04_09930 [Streptomyces sp. CMB-StM0423]